MTWVSEEAVLGFSEEARAREADPNPSGRPGGNSVLAINLNASKSLNNADLRVTPRSVFERCRPVLRAIGCRAASARFVKPQTAVDFRAYLVRVPLTLDPAIAFTARRPALCTGEQKWVNAQRQRGGCG